MVTEPTASQVWGPKYGDQEQTYTHVIRVYSNHKLCLLYSALHLQ
jgi:hypothetical protein